MSSSYTQSRVLQWIGIIIALLVVGGAYWYFSVRASTLNQSKNDLVTNGLVGLWSFNGDDISGVTAYDRSGSGNDGTLTNGPVKVTGRVGQALSFDGTDDYVAVASASSLNPTSAITLSVWVKRVGIGTRQFIMSKGAAGTVANTQYWLEFTTGNVLVFELAGGSTEHKLTTNTTITDTGNWHHIVGTYDGTTQRVYVDGVQDTATLTWSGSINTTTDNFVLGNRSFFYAIPYSGLLDESRVYNRALSTTEIQSLYTQGGGTKVDSAVSQAQGTGRLDSGLSGYWKFDETSGTTAADASTNGNTATLTGATQTWMTGQIGGALDFNGLDDMATVPYSASLTSTTTLSYAFWIKPDLNDGNGFLGSLNGEDGSSYNFIRIDNSGTEAGNPIVAIVRTINAALTTRAVQFAYPVSTWFHGVYTYDGTYERLYINGKILGEWAQTGNFATNTEYGLVFGKKSSSIGTEYDGTLDEVRVYNRSLSGDEVAQLYNLATPTTVDTSLKGYWSFNGTDMNGTTAYDRSGAGNTGTLTGGPTKGVGVVGQGVSFDGTDDYVSVADSAALDFGNTSDFTISGWFNRDTFTTDDTIIAKRNGIASTDDGYILYIDDATDQLILEVSEISGSDEYSFASTSTFTTTGWNHFTVVWDQDSSENSEIFINGIDDTSTPTQPIGGITAIGDLSNASTLRMGTESDNGNPFAGKLDEVRIYNRALAAVEIKSLYDAAAPDKGNSSASQPQGTGRLDGGLTGYWAFDENTGTSATDSSTNGNTGTLTNGPTWTTGQIGSAVTFDGTNDYVNVPSSNTLAPSQMTLAAWVKIGSVPTNYGNIAERGGNGGYRFRINNDQTVSFLAAGVGPTTSAIVDLDVWTHIVVVGSASGRKIYLNGVLSASSATALSGTFNGYNFHIGADTVDGEYFNGSIDEFRFYNRVLSADEVSQVYRLNMPTGADTSLKGYWSFNGQDMNGTAAYDRSGMGNTGTLTGGSTKVPGKIGQGLSFDGSDDYVDGGTATAIQSLDQLSVASWIYIANYPVTGDDYIHAIVSTQTDSGTNSGWAFGLGSYADSTKKENLLFEFRNVGNTAWRGSTVSTAELSLNTWYHVVATYDQTNIKLYIDGVLDTTTAQTEAIANGAGLFLGRKYAGSATNRNWDGKLDETRIYSRALSADEVVALYNQSR